MKEQQCKHCDIMIAKAKNKHLIQFVKYDDKWSEISDHQFISFDERLDYFLCLPRHNEACLHWLNGGKVEFKRGDVWVGYICAGWASNTKWMSEQVELRIKPKTEERWVIATPEALASVIFKSKKLAEQAAKGGQVIEIEVEV